MKSADYFAISIKGVKTDIWKATMWNCNSCRTVFAVTDELDDPHCPACGQQDCTEVYGKAEIHLREDGERERKGSEGDRPLTKET